MSGISLMCGCQEEVNRDGYDDCQMGRQNPANAKDIYFILEL